MTHARQDDASHRGQRGRRAWAALTLACAGVGAGVAFIHGAFLGSAHSEATVSPQPSFQSPRIGVEGTLHVPGSYPTIQAAIDAAADGATIVVAPGVYTERLSLDGRSLVIWGVGGAEVTAIAGDTGRGPIVSLRGGMNRLEGLTLQGGRGETGRGVAVHDGAAVFADCRFRDNAGGVQASGSSLTFARCQFRDNRADFAGGALLLQGGHARLEHCRMESNVARTFGGGVSVMDGQVDLIDTFVTDNRLASGAWGIVPGYLSERFPTEVRGVGTGLAYHVGVGIGSYAPYLIGALQDGGTDLRTAMLMCIMSAGAAVLVLLWVGPETQGRSLE